MRLGDKVRRAREARGFSQHELARLIGVRPNSITDIELNRRQWVRSDVLVKLARVLGVSIDYLVGTWDEQEPDRESAAVA